MQLTKRLLIKWVFPYKVRWIAINEMKRNFVTYRLYRLIAGDSSSYSIKLCSYDMNLSRMSITSIDYLIHV